MMVIYLDYNATAPVDPEVLDAMAPYLRRGYGNPSSLHGPGRAAREAIERAREQVARLANARPGEVVFTSGGTEANNLAIKGAAAALPRGAILVSAIEHSSVLAPARAMEACGWRLREIPVDAEGRVSGEALVDCLDGETRLVSVMSSNNETGAIQPVARLAEIARSRGALFHTDAIQSAGKVELDFAASGAQLMSLSAHKLGGPKGIGALLVDRGVDIEPQMHGGGQESGRRSGTENVPGIVGFGVAAEKAAAGIAARAERLRGLRERLEARLAVVPGVEIFAAGAQRLPNTVCFSVAGIDGGTLLLMLDEAGFALSSGSACASGREEPSHVLAAMGVGRELAYGALRVSLGMENGPGEVDMFVGALEERVNYLRRAVSNFGV